MWWFVDNFLCSTSFHMTRVEYMRNRNFLFFFFYCYIWFAKFCKIVLKFILTLYLMNSLLHWYLTYDINFKLSYITYIIILLTLVGNFFIPFDLWAIGMQYVFSFIVFIESSLFKYRISIYRIIYRIGSSRTFHGK